MFCISCRHCPAHIILITPSYIPTMHPYAFCNTFMHATIREVNLDTLAMGCARIQPALDAPVDDAEVVRQKSAGVSGHTLTVHTRLIILHSLHCYTSKNLQTFASDIFLRVFRTDKKSFENRVQSSKTKCRKCCKCSIHNGYYVLPWHNCCIYSSVSEEYWVSLSIDITVPMPPPPASVNAVRNGSAMTT
mgnify:CR=1 FL=1